MKKLVLALLLASSVASAEKMTVLYEDVDTHPWNLVSKDGVDFILLKMVDEKLTDVEFDYVAVPWKRCLGDIETGAAQSCFSASYKKEREVHGAYPMLNGKPDTSKMLHKASYSLYVLKENADKIKVNGMKIEGIPAGSHVGVPSGYSIGDDLKKEGVSVDSEAKGNDLNMKKLVAKRIIAFATLTDSGTSLLKKPEYKDVVEIKPELVSKDYYMMFSHQFLKAKPDVAKKIWETLGVVRESAEFKKQAEAFLSK